MITIPVSLGQANSRNDISALLVSPFDSDQAALQEVFSEQRWRLHVGADYESARCVLQTEPLAVVICEQWLWDGDWRDVLRACNRLFHPPRVIVASRTADKRLDTDVLLRGGYAILSTPFDAHAIQAAVWLAWHSWRQQWGAGYSANTEMPFAAGG